MCETPAYRRRSPPEAGQQATSSISKPFVGAHVAIALEPEPRERRGQEPEPQRVTSTQRRSAFESAIASPSTFARWPSANVG